MLSTNAQQKARAFLLDARAAARVHGHGMRDWAIEYILHVLEQKDWSANRLASESGVASSTINRPLREPDWPHKLSRSTIMKIRDATGIDPSPFIPEGLAEDGTTFKSSARRVLEQLDQDADGPNAQTTNEIKIAVVGPLAQIVATVDRQGLIKLRKKLDAIESMLDD